MNLSIEFDFDRKTKHHSFVWNLVGKCVHVLIHPDEKEFEKRVFKLLPEKYKSKLELIKITTDDCVFDKTKSLSENKIKERSIVILTIKEKSD